MLSLYKFYFSLFQLEISFQSILNLGRPISFTVLYALYSSRNWSFKRERDSYIKITIHAVSLGTKEAKLKDFGIFFSRLYRESDVRKVDNKERNSDENMLSLLNCMSP